MCHDYALMYRYAASTRYLSITPLECHREGRREPFNVLSGIMTSTDRVRPKKKAYLVFTEGRRKSWTEAFLRRFQAAAPSVMKQVWQAHASSARLSMLTYFPPLTPMRLRVLAFSVVITSAGTGG